MADLAELYDLIKYDPDSSRTADNPWRIDGSTLPAPPEEVHTDKLVINVGEKFSDWISYGNRNDRVQFYATRQTYRYLGYLFFATLFAGRSRPVKLHLTHSRSHIRTLAIDGMDPEPGGWDEGLYLKPNFFGYVRHSVEKYPFEAGGPDRLQCVHDAYDLPRFIVESDAPMVQGPEYWASRNTLRFCPNHTGMALFAQLLLDISFSPQETDEFHLYTHPTFQAVAPGSAEVSIWLPGSFGWDDDSLL